MSRTSSQANLNAALYFPYFDYLRLFLACIVMLGHDRVIDWGPSGNLAVQIFFALSGWLIGGILMNQSITDLPRFYFNRAIRIWVPYLIAIALLVAASLMRDPIDTKWWEFIFYKLTFVYNIFGPPQLALHLKDMPLDGSTNHFWSVNAEEQFYLVAPLLLVVFAKYGGRSRLLWSILSIFAVSYNIYPAIVLGVAAAVLRIHHPDNVNSALCRRTAAAIAALLFAALLGSIVSYDITAPLFSIALVIALSATGDRLAYGELISGISYPLYLNHWIGVFVANFAMAPIGLRDSPARQAVAILLNLLLAAFLYWRFERPLLLRRDSLYSPARAMSLLFIGYGLVLVGLIAGFFGFRGR